MKHILKKTIALLLCLMAFVAIMPVGEADAAYSMYSSSNVKLQIPDEEYLYYDVYVARVTGTAKSKTMSILPKPESGNGDMGTLKENARVIILGEKDGYYLFMNTTGKMGWNKTKYFTEPELVTGEYLPGNSGLTTEQIREVLQFLRENEEDKCGAASKNYYASRAVVVVDKGDSTNITVHGKWYTRYTFSFPQNGDFKAKWNGSFNYNNNCKVKISGRYVGYGYMTFTNDKNSQTFYVLVLVT